MEIVCASLSSKIASNLLLSYSGLKTLILYGLTNALAMCVCIYLFISKMSCMMQPLT